MAEYIAISIALLICIFAAITDIGSLRIYNWLTVPALISGLVWRLSVGGMNDMADGMAGILIAFAVLLIPFMIGAMGAGDVKLMAALGAWVGGTVASYILVIACLLTGIASVIALIRRGGLKAAWLNIRISWFRLQTLKHHLVLDQPDELRSMQDDPDRKSDLIPFSIMLLLAILLVLLIHLGSNMTAISLSSLL